PSPPAGCLLSGVKQTSRRSAATSEFDPGCVKTRTSRECAELFSQILSSDRRCQCNWFLHRRNREGSSTPKSSLRVFTQPRPAADIGAPPKHISFDQPRSLPTV